MARKILMIMLIFCMAFFSSDWKYTEAHAMPVLKEAIKWTIKDAIKKETKSAVQSQLISLVFVLPKRQHLKKQMNVGFSA